MDHMASHERHVRSEQGLTARAQELEVEVLQYARMAQDRPPHRRRYEADDRIPLALLVPIGETQGHRGVMVGHG